MSAKPIAIRNCGAAAGETPAVRFRFQCPRTWDSLEAGPDENIRHCSGCQRFVYFCRTSDEVADRAAHGDCIAVEATMAARDCTGPPLARNTTIIGEPLTDYEPRLDPRPPGSRLPPANP